jgi:hypothetical protein
VNIYIANLENSIDNQKLEQISSAFGEVKSAEVIEDIFTELQEV